ncbi:MAG: hypothetical protein LBV67_04530 [Streptococcaceae bacterium]|jgi:hypothetical protein|nr:hypothetical protein [Streptococcaceae bacterium]
MKKQQLQTTLDTTPKVKRIAMNQMKDLCIEAVYLDILEKGYPTSYASGKAYGGANLILLPAGGVYMSQKKAFSAGTYSKGSELFFMLGPFGRCYYQVVEIGSLHLDPLEVESVRAEAPKVETIEAAFDLMQKLITAAVNYEMIPSDTDPTHYMQFAINEFNQLQALQPAA